MNLSEGKAGMTYILEKTSLPIQTGKRLEALGMTAGTKISVINQKNHGTMVIKLRGTRFAIGKGISKKVEVREA